MLEQAILLSAWAELVPRRLSEEASHLVQPVWWHHGWIPFARDSAENLYCFDLAPLPGGCMGQILEWDPEEGPVRVHSESIQTLLSSYADQLEAGLRLTRGVPFLPMERLTNLAERRAAFLQPSADKPLLYQAIRDGVEAYESKQIRSVLAAYQQVLAMEAASPEDRFFAY